jgi:hypothetical protein
MPHRVDALVQTMQPARLHRSIYGRFVKPCRSHLRSGDDPVLPRRDRRDFPASRGAFLSHGDRKAPQHLVSPLRPLVERAYS